MGDLNIGGWFLGLAIFVKGSRGVFKRAVLFDVGVAIIIFCLVVHEWRASAEDPYFFPFKIYW